MNPSGRRPDEPIRRSLMYQKREQALFFGPKVRKSVAFSLFGYISLREMGPWRSQGSISQAKWVHRAEGPMEARQAWPDWRSQSGLPGLTCANVFFFTRASREVLAFQARVQAEGLGSGLKARFSRKREYIARARFGQDLAKPCAGDGRQRTFSGPKGPAKRAPRSCTHKPNLGLCVHERARGHFAPKFHSKRGCPPKGDPLLSEIWVQSGVACTSRTDLHPKREQKGAYFLPPNAHARLLACAHTPLPRAKRAQSGWRTPIGALGIAPNAAKK